jgi:hypothetical protein
MTKTASQEHIAWIVLLEDVTSTLKMTAPCQGRRCHNSDENTKLNSVVLVSKRTITTERLPLVGEVSDNFWGWRVSSGQRNGSPRPLISMFQTRSRYFSIQVNPQLSSRGWVDPVPDPLLLRKSGRAGNRTRDLWICSQELWPLDHRGGRAHSK